VAKEAKEEVKVTILDRQFTISCRKGERESLLEAATFLDGQIRAVQEQTKLVGVERCAIVAALNISNELLQARHNELDADTLAARLRAIGDQIQSVVGEVS
jgi:cell division protein ZapA|tara:strand:- start:11 stop:313 length:303 start_codon:yes stop_codon:yes gene_type:complete